MQVKIFTIPILGGEAVNEEMNVFLRSKRVLQAETHLIGSGSEACWCFCVKYLDDGAPAGERQRVDYKQQLSEEEFTRFATMKDIRRKLAKDEAVPAYTIFTDEDLAGMAKLEELTLASMRTVKGIGEGKAEKYGKHFLPKSKNEKSEPPGGKGSGAGQSSPGVLESQKGQELFK